MNALRQKMTGLLAYGAISSADSEVDDAPGSNPLAQCRHRDATRRRRSTKYFSRKAGGSERNDRSR